MEKKQRINDLPATKAAVKIHMHTFHYSQSSKSTYIEKSFLLFHFFFLSYFLVLIVTFLITMSALCTDDDDDNDDKTAGTSRYFPHVNTYTPSDEEQPLTSLIFIKHRSSFTGI